MINIWRWDQGRLLYFNFFNIIQISKVLSELEGVRLDLDIDPLRRPLMEYTNLPFAPDHYTVWRNYKRVFESQFLATKLSDRLVITDFCRRLALTNSMITVDDYLSQYIPRFSYPFPAFSDYDSSLPVVYPFCLIIKYLVGKLLGGEEPSIHINDVYPLLVGNQFSGFESIDQLIGIPRTNFQVVGDQFRQLREALIFISQLSILKWFDNQLFLDISPRDYESAAGLQQLITPVPHTKLADRAAEILSFTTLQNEIVYPDYVPTREEPTDLVFTEGNRKRTSHLRIERSPQIRRIYFRRNPQPICDSCNKDMSEYYPWTSNILELHHILPLSSNLTITGHGTSIDDLVGLCPNCHKSIHIYYKNWLNTRRIDDFQTKEEARRVYQEVKDQIILHV